MTLSLVRQKEHDTKIARNKGRVAAAVAASGAVATVALTPWIGVPLAGYGGFLGVKWFLFRIEKGLRW